MSNRAEWSLVSELTQLCSSSLLSIDTLREKTAFIPRRTTKAGRIFERTSIMHRICRNENVDIDIVDHLLDLDPEAAEIYSNIYRNEFHSLNNPGLKRRIENGCLWSYPLHVACFNINCPSSVIQVLARMNPSALSHKSSVKFKRIGFVECVPLQIYLSSRGSNIDIDAVKVLVDTLPEDLVTQCVQKFLRSNRIGVQLDVVRFLIEQKQLPTHDGLTLLHAALSNTHGCPSAIILLLAEKYPFALTHQCSLDCNGLEFDDATPLEIYLRSWHHIDFTVAEVLLQPLPEAMIADCLISYLRDGRLEGHLDIVKLLIEREPSLIETIQIIDEEEEATLLHQACRNDNVTLEVIQFLAGERNDLTRHVNAYNELPLHDLCLNTALDDTTSLEIMEFLLACHPESVRCLSSGERLPLHFSASFKSADFCKVLVHAFPESVSEAADERGNLPLHYACRHNSLETVEYFYSLDPKSIDAANIDGMYPIHLAIKNNQSTQVTRFLLRHHPEEAARAVNDHQNTLPLHLVSNAGILGPNGRERNLIIAEILFDVYPEAILMRNNDLMLPLDVASEFFNNDLIRRFLETHTDKANNARNIDAMTRTDENGHLPLHQAILDGDRLGSIKLIVNGNPSAVQAADVDGALPLHLACRAEKWLLVNYLLELDSSALGQSDRRGNSPLHYACFGGNISVIKHLLQKQPQPVSTPNADKKLPIHLLWECNEDIDRESAKYVEAVWRLLRACPATSLSRVYSH